MDLNSALTQNAATQQITEVIEQIIGLPDDISEDEIDILIGAVKGAITPNLRESTIQQLVNDIPGMGYTISGLQNMVTESKQATKELIDDINPVPLKRKLLEEIFGIYNNVLEEAVERYLNGAQIKLPFKLDTGAKVPTYAHDSDACADVYASEDYLVKAHTIGNMIHTGLHIALPDGWQARLAPRSSTGSKTPLRMSNSHAIIDTMYRGEIMILYDNNSDSDYQIKAGDRIAQMWVEPVYRFKAEVVDELPEATERGNQGFGSTGK